MIIFKDQSPLQIFQQNIPSELLRKDGSSRLLNNFQKFLKLKKSLDDCQQDLYTAVFCRTKEDSDTITLTRTDNTEDKVDPEPFLSCVRGSRVSIRDVKAIKAEVEDVYPHEWSKFNLLPTAGSVIQEIRCGEAFYSPTIHEMIQEGKLLKLR